VHVKLLGDSDALVQASEARVCIDVHIFAFYIMIDFGGKLKYFFMYVCAYVNVYMYCVYIYVFVWPIYTRKKIYVAMCVCIYVHIQRYDMRTYVFVIYIYIYIFVIYIYIYIHSGRFQSYSLLLLEQGRPY
jgi:hypothetical protein